MKLNEGAQGAGVILTEKASASRGVVEALRGLYANFIVQEFIGEAEGADLRCFVVGDRVVAAMRRQAADGDFRSNLHLGGTAAMAEASPQEQDVAVRSARALGLSVAGVDLIRSQRGPWCWRSTPPRAWRGWRGSAAWMWRAPSSSIWSRRSVDRDTRCFSEKLTKL